MYADWLVVVEVSLSEGVAVVTVVDVVRATGATGALLAAVAVPYTEETLAEELLEVTAVEDVVVV
jgi:hypothetical protein